MLSSRYASGLGYSPQLFAGRYNFAPQNALADAYQPAPPPAPAPAPRAPAAAPSLTTGTGALSGSYSGGVSDGGGGDAGSSIGSTPDGGITGLGPNPGNLDNNFGQANLGTMGAALGTALGIGFGVPGLGLAAGALGTFADTRGLNADLEAMGLTPGVQFGSALANNMSFGMFGQSALDQFGNIMGFEALAEAPLSAFASQTVAPSGQALGSDFGGFGTAEGQAAAQAASDAVAAGFGPESAGYGSPAGMGDVADMGSMADAANAQASQADAAAAAADSAAAAADASSAADAGAADGSAGSDGGNGGDGGSGGDGGDGGYYRGGFTGYGNDGMLNPYEPAGTVHEGEVVIPAHQVARYGLEPLMALVRGDMPVNALAGMMRAPAPTSANALLSQIRYG